MLRSPPAVCRPPADARVCCSAGSAPSTAVDCGRGRGQSRQGADPPLPSWLAGATPAVDQRTGGWSRGRSLAGTRAGREAPLRLSRPRPRARALGARRPPYTRRLAPLSQPSTPGVCQRRRSGPSHSRGGRPHGIAGSRGRYSNRFGSRVRRSHTRDDPGDFWGLSPSAGVSGSDTGKPAGSTSRSVCAARRQGLVYVLAAGGSGDALTVVVSSGLVQVQ